MLFLLFEIAVYLLVCGNLALHLVFVCSSLDQEVALIYVLLRESKLPWSSCHS